MFSSFITGSNVTMIHVYTTACHTALHIYAILSKLC